MKPRLRGSGGYSRHLCDLVDGKIEVVAQNYQEAVFDAQTFERVLNIEAVDDPVYEEAVARFGIGAWRHIVPPALERQLAAPICDYAEEPRLDRRVAAYVAELAPRRQDCVLGRILSSMPVAEDAKGKPEPSQEQRSYQRAEGFAVSPTRAFD